MEENKRRTLRWEVKSDMPVKMHCLVEFAVTWCTEVEWGLIVNVLTITVVAYLKEEDITLEKCWAEWTKNWPICHTKCNRNQEVYVSESEKWGIWSNSVRFFSSSWKQDYIWHCTENWECVWGIPALANVEKCCGSSLPLLCQSPLLERAQSWHSTYRIVLQPSLSTDSREPRLTWLLVT